MPPHDKWPVPAPPFRSGGRGGGNRPSLCLQLIGPWGKSTYLSGIYSSKRELPFIFAPYPKNTVMAKNFVQELQWRGMLHDVMPGAEEHLTEGVRSDYVGIEPTADSLPIGHLVGVMMLKHFQLAGHKPYALIGGAT